MEPALVTSTQMSSRISICLWMPLTSFDTFFHFLSLSWTFHIVLPIVWCGFRDFGLYTVDTCRHVSCKLRTPAVARSESNTFDTQYSLCTSLYLFWIAQSCASESITMFWSDNVVLFQAHQLSRIIKNPSFVFWIDLQPETETLYKPATIWDPGDG